MSRRPAYKIHLSKSAAADLRVIFAYYAKVAPLSAPSVVDEILRNIDRLKSSPHRQVVPGQSTKLARPVRLLPVDPYVVFFRVLEDEGIIRILRVRHGRRRPLKRF